MDWDAIGAVGEVVGAIAVVLTLGYLAKQVKQQIRSNEGDAVRDVVSSWTSAIKELVSDEATADLIMRGLKDYGSLQSAGERGVFHGRLTQIFNAHLSFVDMAYQGLVPQETADSVADELAQILNSPGAATWWAEIGPLYNTYEAIEARRKIIPPFEHPTVRLIQGLEQSIEI